MRLSKEIRKIASLTRQISSKHDYDNPSKEALKNCLENFRSSLDSMIDGTSSFLKIDSRHISSDGKLGGRGNVAEIKEIRGKLLSATDTISGIIDTIEDELSGKHWAKIGEPEAAVEKNNGLIEEVDITQLTQPEPDFGEEEEYDGEEFQTETEETPEELETKEISEESIPLENVEEDNDVEEEAGNVPEEEIIDQGQIKDKKDEEKITEEPEELEP